MVRQFKVGKVYRFTGNPDDYHEPSGVTISGMNDGVPRMCIASNWKGLIKNKLSGNFEGIPRDPHNLDYCWDFTGEQHDFEEVKDQDSPR